jgi:dienelactone hydrolase
MTSLVLGLVLLPQAGYSASFADAWDRWKQVDGAWNLAETRSRHGAALPHLKVASNLLFSSSWGEACRELDEALAKLQNKPLTPEQAVNLRFRPPASEPGRPARLVVSWAYRPAPARSFPLRIGNRQVTLNPGQGLTLEVIPSRLEPELAQNPELGVPVAAQVGETTRTVYLSVLKQPRQRIQTLLASEDPFVKALGQKALTMLEAPLPSQTSVSIVSVVGLAESYAKGRTKLSEVTSIPHARQGQTSLQIEMSKATAAARAAPVTVVVATSGFAGESAFYENFGQAAAIEEALKRGWIFIGASAGERAVPDALNWIESKLGRKVSRYFALGYSRGAGPAFAAGSLKPPPAAVAALAPASIAVPRAWTNVPLFLAVGNEDAPRVVGPILSAARELAGRKDVRLFEAEGAEHLMLPGEAVRKAFAFFDELSSSAPLPR